MRDGDPPRSEALLLLRRPGGFTLLGPLNEQKLVGELTCGHSPRPDARGFDLSERTTSITVPLPEAPTAEATQENPILQAAHSSTTSSSSCRAIPGNDALKRPPTSISTLEVSPIYSSEVTSAKHVHFVLQAKGGIGKSFVSTLLAQYVGTRQAASLLR